MKKTSFGGAQRETKRLKVVGRMNRNKEVTKVNGTRKIEIVN